MLTNDPSAHERHFEAPWQAMIFALIIKMHEDGRFEWSEFADCLAAVISQYEQQGIERDYYANWLEAALRLLSEKRLITERSLLDNIQGVEHHRAHDHGHKAQTKPIAIDPALEETA